jgi:hypothetical protein
MCQQSAISLPTDSTHRRRIGRNLGELRPPSAALPDLIALDTVDHFLLVGRGGLLSAGHMAR